MYNKLNCFEHREIDKEEKAEYKKKKKKHQTCKKI